MTLLTRQLELKGTLTYRLYKSAVKAPLSWRIRNTLRWGYIWGWLTVQLARLFSRITGIPTFTSELRSRLLRANGSVVDFGVVSRRVVTDAGVAALVDDWVAGTFDIGDFNYHACGTDNTAESTSDTALGAEASSITSRVAGTKSEPAANQVRSVGTQAFTGAGSIVEHGLFSASTAGTLWDRSVFAAINVGNGDQIEWTYTLTVNSGG